METFLSYLPVLACAGMMLVICIPMMRNMHKSHRQTDDSPMRDEIADLREEVARLKAERALSEREPVDG